MTGISTWGLLAFDHSAEVLGALQDGWAPRNPTAVAAELRWLADVMEEISNAELLEAWDECDDGLELGDVAIPEGYLSSYRRVIARDIARCRASAADLDRS